MWTFSLILVFSFSQLRKSKSCILGNLIRLVQCVRALHLVVACQLIIVFDRNGTRRQSWPHSTDTVADGPSTGENSPSLAESTCGDHEVTGARKKGNSFAGLFALVRLLLACDLCVMRQECSRKAGSCRASLDPVERSPQSLDLIDSSIQSLDTCARSVQSLDTCERSPQSLKPVKSLVQLL